MLPLDYFVKQGKRYSDFCTIHNKSSILGLRAKIRKELCKCNYITSSESESVITKFQNKSLQREEKLKDYAHYWYDISKYQSATCVKFKKNKNVISVHT